MDYVGTHVLSGTNGVGQASKSPPHPSRSDDNSRVALLVCDERLLAFLYYLEGHGALEPTADWPRKKEVHGRCSWGADESRSESAHCTGSVYRKSRHWWCNSLSPHKMAAATSETEGASAYALHLWRVTPASSYIRGLDKNCRFNVRLLALLRYRSYRFHIMWLCSGTC